jgi:hypothetical protein
MMTVGDRLNIKVNLGNLNGFALNAKVATDLKATLGAVSLALPTSVQQIKGKSTKSVTIPISAVSPTKG